MPVAEAVQNVKESLMEQVLPSLLNGLSAEAKRSLLGEDFIKDILNDKVGGVKKTQQTLKQPSRARPLSKSVSEQTTSEKRAIDIDDFFNSI